MKKVYFCLLLLLSMFAVTQLAYAQKIEKEDEAQLEEQTPAGPTNLTNPLSVSSVPQLIGNIINGVLGVVGSLALLMFIYGGFTWMLSGGNSSAVERGKNILMWAAIGLVVIFMSYALVSFVITTTTT